MEISPEEQAKQLLQQYSGVIDKFIPETFSNEVKWSLIKQCAIDACKLAHQERERAI